MTPFRDIKGGFPLFILDLKEVKASQAIAISVTKPYINSQSGISSMMVDVVADVDGEQRTYTFKDSTDAGYDTQRGQLIATDKDIIVRELQSMMLQSEHALKQVDNHKLIKERCATALSELNPAEKEKKEMEDRISRIEENNNQITKMLTQILQNQRKNDND